MKFTYLLLLTLLPAVQGFAFDVKTKYEQSCATCHRTGIANAPKTGDAAAWKPRMEKGMPVLLQSIANGLNAMPPKGLCFDCSDEQFTALINYMAKPAK